MLDGRTVPSDRWYLMESDLVAPEELAQDLMAVYRDLEASAFERNLAAVGLTVFWLGVEVDRLTKVLEEQQ